MEQLKKAYEAIEMLQALELPVSDEQLRAIAKLEKEYLQDEIIPLLKQELEPFVTKLRSKLQMEVTFDKDKGLNMQLIDQVDRKPTSIIKDADSVSTRDTSKYSIDGGEPLKKRRFVLAVVRKYVESHPDITYEQLRERFPDGIESKLQELSIDERKDLMCQIIEEAEKIFEVDSVNFEILYPTPVEEFYAYGCGFYNRKDNLLYSP